MKWLFWSEELVVIVAGVVEAFVVLDTVTFAFARWPKLGGN